jgi:dimethylglycine dehydrogenase
MADAEALYDALWQAGEEFGMVNFGLYAVNSLRIEKAYRGWGDELTNEVTLLDADMERFIKFDKDDFVGREATLQLKEKGLATRLVYFDFDASESDVRGSEPVYDGDKVIGITTSGGYGHCVQKSLGFAYVEPQYAEPGTRFAVDLLGERCMATVRPDPVYDPENKCLRA